MAILTIAARLARPAASLLLRGTAPCSSAAAAAAAAAVSPEPSQQRAAFPPPRIDREAAETVRRDASADRADCVAMPVVFVYYRAAGDPAVAAALGYRDAADMKTRAGCGRVADPAPTKPPPPPLPLPLSAAVGAAAALPHVATVASILESHDADGFAGPAVGGGGGSSGGGGIFSPGGPADRGPTAVDEATRTSMLAFWSAMQDAAPYDLCAWYLPRSLEAEAPPSVRGALIGGGGGGLTHGGDDDNGGGGGGGGGLTHPSSATLFTSEDVRPRGDVKWIPSGDLLLRCIDATAACWTAHRAADRLPDLPGVLADVARATRLHLGPAYHEAPPRPIEVVLWTDAASVAAGVAPRAALSLPALAQAAAGMPPCRWHVITCGGGAAAADDAAAADAGIEALTQLARRSGGLATAAPAVAPTYAQWQRIHHDLATELARDYVAALLTVGYLQADCFIDYDAALSPEPTTALAATHAADAAAPRAAPAVTPRGVPVPTCLSVVGWVDAALLGRTPLGAHFRLGARRPLAAFFAPPAPALPSRARDAQPHERDPAHDPVGARAEASRQLVALVAQSAERVQRVALVRFEAPAGRWGLLMSAAMYPQVTATAASLPPSALHAVAHAVGELVLVVLRDHRHAAQQIDAMGPASSSSPPRAAFPAPAPGSPSPSSSPPPSSPSSSSSSSSFMA
ncbi:hypothetical protein CXG81DRAFT_18190 [Caulochytrium protostelioides]|uniref:Uncharacterized protein n=1 Tax=Caulochytrium protostelioides TaxID=1555241 RepID=A0A4P9XAC1_9FUNG|nr:hypothetical protein CXG81DRAFT_18190 [Caulochytrium protostelioides]|eukprot:RKP02080.1 hypothetical protein CXG81DRAFT_18190 [Caulochytrium protostelioides]